MSRVYVVQGSTGEYSDRTDWLVKAFLDEERGRDLMTSLNSKCSELGLAAGFTSDYRAREAASKIMAQCDEGFQCDYTGTYYTLLTVELET